ncbi:MAG: nprA [Bacteroidetes bacterium]|jgi:serine phosphatase RsbU (regulator of sigma subunit)|nr:nprA [Bacteroidota bacterium]
MNLNFRKVFTCLLLIASLHFFADTKDSLVQVLKSKKDTARISVLIKICDLSTKDSTFLSNPYLGEIEKIAYSSPNKKYEGDYHYLVGQHWLSNRNFDKALAEYKLSLSKYKLAESYSDQCKAFRAMGQVFGMQNKMTEALSYFKQASAISKSQKLTRDHALNQYMTARTFYFMGEHKKAMDPFNESFECYRSLNDSDKMASIYNQIGSCYRTSTDFASALTSYQHAQKIYEKLKNKKEYAGCEVNTGTVYYEMGNKDKALNYFLSAEKLLEEIDYKLYLGNVRFNIASIYLERDNFEKALPKLLGAKQTFLELKDLRFYSDVLANLVYVHAQRNEYPLAEKSLIEALEIKERMEDQNGLIMCYQHAGSLYLKMKNFSKSIAFYEKALALAKTVEDRGAVINTFKNLADVFNDAGNYKQSVEFYQKYISAKDSVFQKESADKVAELETRYNTEKKENQIAILNKDKEVNEKQLKVKSLQQNMLLIGLGLLLVVAFLIYNRYRIKQQSNIKLQSAFNEIEANRDEIASQKKEIVDSIQYAKRIQQAILPPKQNIYTVFNDSFVLYNPKDVVSGDFYAFFQKDNLVTIAVADCTGHGVPGAFMSMIGMEQLTRIITERGISQPDIVLNELNKGVRYALKQDQDNSETRDGMDIALCTFDLHKNSLQYSGAMRPLWIVRNKELIEIKANKFAIGGIDTADKKLFTNNSIQLQKNDCLFMFTDGYADQFGGANGKKFMLKNFSKKLIEVSDLPMKDIEPQLFSAFNTWKGNNDQVDDILVIGIRI